MVNAVAPETMVPAMPVAAGPTRWRLARRDPLGAAGLAIIALLVVLAVAGPFLAPYPEQGAGASDVANRMLGPSLAHPFGTDELGRDLLSRVIMGTRSGLLVAVLVVGLAMLVGVPLGALAGYRRGRIDALIMRITDLFLAFPPLLLAMAIVAALGPGLENAALALAISWWPWYARLQRATTTSLRERPFIEAARAAGMSDTRVIVRHILPNSMGPILVQATTDIGTVILAAGGLAFLGLGATPPDPDWGLMVAQGRAFILDQWWLSTFPGLAIFVSVLAFNLVGDALLDLVSPRRSP